MRATDLHLEPNEASDLTPVLDREALQSRGFDHALATVLDESPAEECVAVLLHESGAGPDDGWSARRIPTKGKPKKARGKTEDAEACAVANGFLYVFGSQYGSKDGPLQAKRQWAARIAEADLADHLGGGSKPKMEIARLDFALHRAINDALARTDLDLFPMGAQTRAAYIDGTIRKAAKKGKDWLERISSADQPVNVEASAFRPDGRLLLGLRHPVTRDGQAILVELDDVDALFAKKPEAHCSNVWILEGAGAADQPVGLRALHATGPDRFEGVVGNLDSTGKGSVVIADHPEAGEATSLHVAFELPLTAAGGPVHCDVVHDFEELRRVEGLSVTDGRAHYVVDRDGRIELATLAVD